ncbi:NAD-dependent epimerase/dehydratase family protein [Sphingomonas gilva]|uniref:NAD-dependent epimerase/dehydratase family protein n=1 Tax=Sphingomonas gilva TaxID=2305907 RepID=A0A396RK97_9SPHN|nr:GDP-mannose 4,6-dehydratase [Sphingomonas gilva]RHW16648.1 NAD-dependent epimerase/dehydratase family protein [Sphingomonas gilva]
MASTILVTGAAGFIGMSLSRRLLDRGDRVIGVDNLNDYYSVPLKRDRLAELRRIGGDRFRFEQVDFSDHAALDSALAGSDFDRIVHLGAQAGVRYSIDNPRAYVQSNLVGHLNLLELARQRGSSHMVYASSSSVYGGNTQMPFSVDDRVDHPLSLYAATKKSDELMSETYAHLYRLPLTGLRFFTVYGPWGRPDMAMWIFTKAILEDRPIAVYNFGDMHRDFTYIDDIVTGVVACVDNPPPDDGQEHAGGSRAPHRIYNIGNHRSERLGDMIDLIEAACGKRAIRDLQPIQPGDVPATFADISAIQNDLGFEPATSIDIGVPAFVEWYRRYHQA